MAMSEIGASGAGWPAALSRSAEEAAPAEQRALVPVHEGSAGDSPGSHSRRPAAPFLAHLIATAQDEPQTREKRRTTPALAAHAYAAALKLDSEP